MAQKENSLLSLLPQNSFVMARRASSEVGLETPRFFQIQGSKNPELIFVGKDIFQGEAGELLSRMIASMRPPEDSVALVNLVYPQDFETSQGISPHGMFDELLEFRPRIVVLLGQALSQLLLETQESWEVLRNQKITRSGLQIRVTEAPQELIRDPAAKRASWSDLKRIMQDLHWKIS